MVKHLGVVDESKYLTDAFFASETRFYSRNGANEYRGNILQLTCSINFLRKFFERILLN